MSWDVGERCFPYVADAESNKGLLGTAKSLRGMEWTRHLVFSVFPQLGQSPKGLETQRGFMET